MIGIIIEAIRALYSLTKKPRVMINCFTSKENEQIGFEVKSNRKLTNFDISALVKGFSFETEIQLPDIRGNYIERVLYRNLDKKYLLAGEPLPRRAGHGYNQLDGITSYIKERKSHKITIIITCNEMEEKIVKKYNLIFNSWDKIDFYEE